MIELDNTEDFSGSKNQNDSWIIEAIWGHRIERQPFSALMLEFLGMAEGMYRQKKLFAHTSPSDNPIYVANRSLQLRNILFNNPQMEEILRNSLGDDASAWEKWLEVMKISASVGENLSPDFSYLKNNFETFGELVNVVRLLRNITIDQESERGWTTQFIFPIGPAALYEALLERGDKFERTRRVFTRTGELGYLMVSRASEELRNKIERKLAHSFDPNGARNKLVLRLLSSDEPDKGEKKSGTYLPYKTHPAYNRMAEDISAILDLDLPDQDSFEFIQPLLGLHIYLYGIETASHWVGTPEMPPMVCEILAPRSDLVRKAAVASYLDNDGLGSQAVRTFIDTTLFSDPDLKRMLANNEADDESKRDYLLHFLEKSCALNKEGMANAPDTKSLIQNFYSFADKFYRSYAADGLTGLATGCGFVSRRGTTRFRYAPTDGLLRALVLANVTAPVEEGAFLRRLYDRYRIVIGPVEAKATVRATLFDETDFKKNRDRLVQHLIGMGLAQRMSDACTYVLNPMDEHA
ncbi:hypothetical protein RGU70_02835 [Herbaspirillum sp. RTI4]|uniref:hypothetical protein n=1 Tax=Herbaspirillum sp. RTI4 TaxID=3048640 RepID=UPI002AB36254|nr:hypothetical protein [Herbaspirillum sp. RTI4]MDY7577265.1 hypothetical protein [Herbaspirillum sp. RTI4]MEA9980555.1 hypothetical protein [Herbaspirillum sp. RTI4]